MNLRDYLHMNKKDLQELYWAEEDFNWISIDEKPYDVSQGFVVVKDRDDEVHVAREDEDREWTAGFEHVVYPTHYSQIPPPKTVFKEGNLIKALDAGEIDIIAHACNKTVGMGAGISKALRLKFEINDDEEKLIREDTDKFLFEKNGKFLCNIYCMIFPGRATNGSMAFRDSVYYDTLKGRFYRLKYTLEELCLENPGKRIGIPLVLSGLAKQDLDMEDLTYFKKYILPHIQHLPITVYHL